MCELIALAFLNDNVRAVGEREVHGREWCGDVKGHAVVLGCNGNLSSFRGDGVSGGEVDGQSWKQTQFM